MAISDFEGLPEQDIAPSILGIGGLSYLRFSRVYGDDGDLFLGSAILPTIEPDPATDGYHRISPGEIGRLDLISTKHYSTYRLAWIIGYVNNIYNPLTDMVAGEVLRIPDQNRIYNLLALSRS